MSISQKSIKNKIKADIPFIYTGKDELFCMEKMQNYNKSIINHIKQHMGATAENILDFGAGIGTLASYFPKDKITCLEIDSEQSDILKQRGFQTISSLKEIKKNSLSFLYSSNVLEHIEDDHDTVKQIYEKIKSNGRVVFYVPAFPILYSEMDKKVGHFRRYTKKTLTSVFASAGFSVDKVMYSDSLGFFASLLFKLISSKDGTASPKQLLFYDRFIFPISSFFDKLFASHFFGKNIVIYVTKL
jgi:SAM-dependent methyltransferase